MPVITAAPLLDMHVHLREPGQTHKEDIASGTAAAKAGGFGALACMPNTVPPLDTPERVRNAAERAAAAGAVRVWPVAAVTKGQQGLELTDFAALKAAGAAALSDDGFPVKDASLMRCALALAHRAGLPLIAHCEPETELAVRDIAAAGALGVPIHIAHVSRRETVGAIRAAKAQGVRVTAETCPHYFLSGASGRMNPPLASPDDIQAVLDGLADGTIDVIATDHAPHTQAEKDENPLLNGVIGLETAVAAALTGLYHTGILSLEQILFKMREAPAKILGVPVPEGRIVIDTDAEWTADSAAFRSKSRNTPFAGMTLRGKVLNTSASSGEKLQ